ncbi:MAG: hypothetical protein JST66_00065, partial [Bacteroidetes bacterium]|nr:hypothetical protein [Bacteroidota bacterium]
MRTVLLVLCLFPAVPTRAQEAALLDARARKEVVRNVAERLENAYVLPDVGRRMGERIRRRLAAGGYAAITDPVALADALTGDLQAVQPDGHLLLRYMPPQAAPADPP